MWSPKINTKVINVELTNQRQKQIITNLAPITRLINGGRGVRCNVIIRKIHRSFTKDVFSVMVRLSAEDEVYYAIAHNAHFSRAISRASEKLRKNMSKAYYQDTQQVQQLQKIAHEKYFVELFV